MYFEKILGVSEIPEGAKLIQRKAVRGVALKNQRLIFMIHTAKGDYKFPGGGIEDGENHLTALTREFIEETGYAISDEIQPIGLIVEQRPDAYEPNAYFVMKSYYYMCEIRGENQGQKLDEYEKKMNFKGEYVSIFDAYRQNEQLLKVGTTDINPWVKREIIALENIMMMPGVTNQAPEGQPYAYESITLQKNIVVDNIVSIHYFEYMSDFMFEGEAHDFWEFLCVDKGTVTVTAGTATHTLNKGDMIFHKPNEFHTVRANGIVAPNLVVIAFQCDSPDMCFFQGKILVYSADQRDLLARIIREARTAFTSRLDDPYCEKLIRAEKAPYAAEQLIQMYLQQILIGLRRNTQAPGQLPLPKTTRQRNEEDLFNRVAAYMEDRLDTQLTLEQICRDNLVGRSPLQKLFHEHASCGVIDYFSNMKINTAKEMIREQHMNFTQIAYSLGYNSIHYFSRKFKQVTGMTPSEYASSIKLLSESGRGY